MSSLAGVHSVHGLHHHLHLLLLLELVVTVVVTSMSVSRGIELVVVHGHLVHVILEHHLLLVVLLEEGVGRLREVSTAVASGHHVAATSTVLVSSTAVTATSLVALVARYGA